MDKFTIKRVVPNPVAFRTVQIRVKTYDMIIRTSNRSNKRSSIRSNRPGNPPGHMQISESNRSKANSEYCEEIEQDSITSSALFLTIK